MQQVSVEEAPRPRRALPGTQLAVALAAAPVVAIVGGYSYSWHGVT